MADTLESMSDYLVSDPLNAWDSRRARQMVADEQAAWLARIGDWKNFITLTTRDIRERDVCDRYFRRLIQVLNRDAFGKHYVRKVGHSYFSYVVATEKQERDAVHFHVLTDRAVNYDLVHAYWNRVMGFAWIEPTHSQEAVTNYCSKYCVKDGMVAVYRTENTKVPLIGDYPPMEWR